MFLDPYLRSFRERDISFSADSFVDQSLYDIDHGVEEIRCPS